MSIIEPRQGGLLMTLNSATTLRFLLTVDALISGVTGIAMIATAAVLEPFLSVPAVVMRSAGVALLPFAAMVFFFSRPAQFTPARVRVVIALNVAWVAASVLVLVTGWLQPTAIGVAFVVFQALVVAGLAELQFTGLRRASAV
jgi:hypothetical protein